MALRRARLLALLLLVLVVPPAAARSIDGTVLRIVDGDTIDVQLADRVEKIRYIGVNAPEIHHPIRGEEPGGREAAEVNRRLVASRHVRLELDLRTRDRYDGFWPTSGQGTRWSTRSSCAWAMRR